MEKQVVGGDDSLNLIPIKYQYAYEFYQNGKKNFWIPQEIPVGEDIMSFRHKLTEAEKHVFTHVFAQLSTMDIGATDVVVQIAHALTSPEHKMALATQAFQEAVHSESYAYCAEHIGMDEEWLWSRWKDVPAIKAKIDFTMEVLGNDNYPLIYKYFFLAVIFESTWFMCGFNPIFALARAGKVKQVAEMLGYIARDEQQHVHLGISSINSIIEETNLDREGLAEGFSELANKAYLLEKDYIEFIFSEGNYMGYSIDEHLAHITFRLNRGFTQLRLNKENLSLYHKSREPSWIGELLMLRREGIIFEVKSSEYQKTQLQWDDKPTKEVPGIDIPTGKYPDYSCDDHSCCE